MKRFSLSHHERPLLAGKGQFTLHIICISFQVLCFADNFRKYATLNAFHEEIFKLHFFKVGVFFQRNSFTREDAAFCFVI